jgi:hypothetical protein
VPTERLHRGVAARAAATTVYYLRVGVALSGYSVRNGGLAAIVRSAGVVGAVVVVVADVVVVVVAAGAVVVVVAGAIVLVVAAVVVVGWSLLS